MYILEQIKKDIIKQVNEALGTSTGSAQEKIVKASDLVYPPKKEMGDLSLPCFEIARQTGKPAHQLAEELIQAVKNESFISGSKVVGPYLNITINKKSLGKELIKEIKKQQNDFGANNTGKQKKVMIEYSNVNTHKEYHIGHLRNICFGDAIFRLLEKNGYDAIPASYVNDFGSHVAKTVWNYHIKQGKWDKMIGDKGYVLGQIYVDACEEEKKNPTAKSETEVVMKKIESRKGDEYKLWQETRKWSIEYFNKIYKELQVNFQVKMYESEFIEDGRKIVNKLTRQGILEESQGAIIANLEKYNLGVLVFIRSDGTATYPVADIPLALHKLKKYQLDKSIYVVDIRQSLYFRQLFKILHLIGYKQEMIHLDFEFVKLPSGMMSSRSGNVIAYEELKQKILEKTKKETKKRHEDWEEEKIEEVAKKVAFGAIKFEMIKVGADQEITFDINKALSLSGFTSAYLQYTYARINSVIKKSKVKNKKLKVDFEKLIEEKEHSLILKLAKYPETVKKAGEKYDPSEICRYLFELAQEFNDYYHSVPILKTEEDIRLVRLALIFSVKQVLENGCALLGIETFNEM
jgi:arginyl-tRNA synthetase